MLSLRMFVNNSTPVWRTVYSVYAVDISSVLCGDLLLQPLVAIVYIELAAVAVSI